MKGFKRLCLSGALLISLVACAGKNVKDDVDDSQNDAKKGTFERGLKALEKEDYPEAAKIFDQLLVSKPATEFDLVTLYNSAAAYEGMGECAKAADRYRQIVRSSSGKFGRVEAQSLFRLSLMYECLGDDAKTITSLLDARKRGQNLPFETLNAEMPARLAAAYARIGNRAKALEFFNQASAGLKKIVARSEDRQQKELLSRTLYLMGQLSPTQRSAEVEASSFMQSLSMQQPYLLQAAELDHPVWSKRAAADLRTGYDNIWKFELKDENQQRDFYSRGLQTIQELRKIRLPKSPPAVAALFGEIDKVEGRLHAALAKIAETNKLTPEAQKREGLKREGRVVDPQPPVQQRKKKP